MSLASSLNIFRHLRLIQGCCQPRELMVYQTRGKRKDYDRRYLIDTSVKKDLGNQGESAPAVEVLTAMPGKDRYPDADTPTTLYNGIPFKDLPICHIKTSKNNTLMNITDAEGFTQAYWSCGCEGFKNARKGTNVAAQATAVEVAKKAIAKGIHTVRVKIEGLGPGRMSSVKGLAMAGLNIVSVTDSTHVSFHPVRPRKARRL